MTPSRTLLKLIAVFEIISGLSGPLVVGWMIWRSPFAMVCSLVALVAGVLLWLRWKYSVLLSILVQFVQVPFIHVNGRDLHLGLALNFEISRVLSFVPWYTTAAGNGVDFLALAVLIGLLSCLATSANDLASHNLFNRTPRSIKRLLGYLLAFCGAIFLFPGITLKTFGKSASAARLYGFPRLVAVVFRAVGTLMVLFGRAVFVEGKKLSTVPADRLLARDKRAPVLYLRSFELEPLTNRPARTFRGSSAAAFTSSSADTSIDLSFDLEVQTQEEILSKVLRRVGPCVAVGDPRSDEIVLGFSRMKLGDDWQERVQELIKQSALVVHSSGGTPGLLWELEQVAGLVMPRTKLLLLVTPTITQEWWALADRLFGPVHRFTVSLETWQPYVAVIYFDESGKPCSELVYGVDRPPRVVLEEALDPLLHQLKIRTRPRLLRWFSNPTHWFYLLGFILGMFLFFGLAVSFSR